VVELWPDSVLVDGAAIALADVFASVTIHHGRVGAFDDPSSSTCQITILDVDKAFVRPFRTGAELAITAAPKDGGASAPRFSGRITDCTLDVNALTVVAASTLSRLESFTVSTVDWPREYWSERVNRAFSEAGLAGTQDFPDAGDFNPILVARVASPRSLSAELAALAPMVGAAIADRPDGRVLIQPLSARSLSSMVSLDPALVEYAPEWDQVLPDANVVTVNYAGGSVTRTDEESRAHYDDRPLVLETEFESQADAETLARLRVATFAWSHWNILGAPLLAGVELAIGTPIELSELPPASPYNPWTPILEGWRDQIDGDAWTMELALSDPSSSGLTLPWEAVPADYLWNTINPATAWRDALTLDSLTPV
jgi:hypothetical protein